MNIQNLVSSVKKARKRRQIFLFHDNPRSGIDVPEDDWNFVISLITVLFKFYKAKGCNIEVTWWGEILFLLPNFGTPFEISINHKPNHIEVDAVLKKAKDSGVVLIGNLGIDTSMALSVRTVRKRTKWHSLSIDVNEAEYASLAEKVNEHIQTKISPHYKQDDELDKLREITKEDLIAAIRLGGVLLGKNSMLHYLSAELDRRIYISKLTISDSTIIIDAGRLYEESIHYFGKKEMKFFLQYLPEKVFLTS
ncbi:MAG: hypothetical protein ACI9EK_002575 [Psychroserpens sp.]